MCPSPISRASPRHGGLRGSSPRTTLQSRPGTMCLSLLGRGCTPLSWRCPRTRPPSLRFRRCACTEACLSRRMCVMPCQESSAAPIVRPSPPNPIPYLGGAAQPHQAGPHRCRGAAVLPLKPHLELRPAASDLGGSGLCQPRSQCHGGSCVVV